MSVLETKKPTREDEAHTGAPKKKKPKQEVALSTYVETRTKRRVHPPHVNYTVRDSDVYNDLAMMRRTLPRAQLES